jgi:hypothetical protein
LFAFFLQNKPKKKPKPLTTATSPVTTIAGLPVRNVIPTHAPTLEAMLKTVTTAQPTVTMLARLPLISKTIPAGTPILATATLTKPTIHSLPPHPPPLGGSKKKQSESAASTSQPKSPRRQPAKKQVKRSRSCENPVKTGEVFGIIHSIHIDVCCIVALSLF